MFFSNDFQELCDQISQNFGNNSQEFFKLLEYIDCFDPFQDTPYTSTRKVLHTYISDPHLVDILMCPLMYYGSSWQHDMDFSQFVIMFRSIFQEGMFRPAGTIKDLLDLLVKKFTSSGGTLLLKKGVSRINSKGKKILSVTLDNGDEITCDYLLSTIGLDETRFILGDQIKIDGQQRLGFLENIYIINSRANHSVRPDRTCIFYFDEPEFSFTNPAGTVNFSNGVICLPANFRDRASEGNTLEIRTTHLANYDEWDKLSENRDSYLKTKKECAQISLKIAERFVGDFGEMAI